MYEGNIFRLRHVWSLNNEFYRKIYDYFYPVQAGFLNLSGITIPNQIGNDGLIINQKRSWLAPRP